jgi:hypothetical protein
LAHLERQQHDVFPCRQSVEVLRRLERVAQIAGPRHDELVGAMALAHQTFDLVQLRAPSVGGDRLLGDVAVEHRASCARRHRRAEFSVAAALNDAPADFVDYSRNRQNL